ncbi:hypothetical protein [Streptomyces spectabilis]|uniref:Uncharacterized protein n=1 Tax=Streptomyces spectabilis TaxID=68270 RepID=A0A7W8EXX9_STRST|nr:hypothetical protein [Streptomyces spectabilis]MBB5108266.1 hypothetical protein [Streptomyces spectabilis]MCI3901026.1 hypothetical protein [Streptomyces spectabilis]GGV45541.1 hypothetical protein GCM10010245_71270 [Streptomyces spectabilis]
MPEPPRPLARRRDNTAADLGSLVDLGLTEPPPEPAPISPPAPPATELAVGAAEEAASN